MPSSYACRFCNAVFESIAAREQHELEHPLHNPTMFYRDRELGATGLLINTPVQLGDIEARNVSRIELNGQSLGSVAELTQALQPVSKGLFSLIYANGVLEKNLKIEVCIADPRQVAEVDQIFRTQFSIGSIADPLIEAFTSSVKHCDKSMQLPTTCRGKTDPSSNPHKFSTYNDSRGSGLDQSSLCNWVNSPSAPI